jgi:hypothetical protein
VPAAELEVAVLEQLHGILRTPGMVDDVVMRAVELDPTLDEAQVTVAMTRLNEIWDQLLSGQVEPHRAASGREGRSSRRTTSRCGCGPTALRR